MSRAYGSRSSILARAGELARLHREVHRTFASRHESPRAMQAWRDAAAAFRVRGDPFETERIRLRRPKEVAGDAKLRDFAITFLELDPMYFGSGYFKEEIVRRLKWEFLTPGERERLRAVALDAARHRGQREFRHYCRLARRVADPGLVAELEKIAEDTDGAARNRARKMLAVIRS